MAYHGVLTQQLNAIEWLASAQVICFDKTGTLTDAAPHVTEVIPMPGVNDEELVRMLGRYAGGTSSRNATLAAIADACPGGTEQLGAEIPFTSRRRWSAVQFGSTSYLLGAPELFPPGALRERAEREAQKGRRALAFGLTLTPVAALGTDALPSTGSGHWDWSSSANTCDPRRGKRWSIFSLKGSHSKSSPEMPGTSNASRSEPVWWGASRLKGNAVWWQRFERPVFM